MQSKTFGKAMQFLVAVGTLVSAFTLVACGGSDTKDVNVTVGLTNSTVAVVQGQPLTIPDGQVFTPAITGEVTLTFNSPNTFTLVGSGVPPPRAWSPIAPRAAPWWGPVLTSAPGGLISGRYLTVPSCSLLVTANDVEVGGDR